MKHSFSLSALAAGLAGGAELIPLAMGNYWVYQQEQTGETFTIRVGQPVATQSGKIYHHLIGYTPGYVLARIDQGGNLLLLDEETGGEKILTGFAESDGRWWTAPGHACAQEGQTQTKRVEYDGPGGRWQRVVVVKYQSSACADAGILSEQFAENIGLLQRVVSTLSGPRTFDLVYARVGTQIIETRDRGRFSVSVDQPAGQDYLRVNLRIELGFTPSIRLRFPSSQVFDVALRDAAGQIVWRWSDGRFFNQEIRETAIGNVWSETVMVPKPPGDLAGYTVEGWLTTLPTEPKFAAAAPVPPPRLQPATSDRIASIELSPRIVRGGQVVTATITLEGLAPSPAVTVFLGTVSPLLAQVPIVYYVPAGQKSAQFTITTSAGWPPQDVALSASSGGRTASANLRVE